MAEWQIEISGLKIKYKGDRNDPPPVPRMIEDQAKTLLGLPALVTSATRRLSEQEEPATDAPEEPKSRKRQSANGAKRVRAAKEEPLMWKHEAERWGTPRQSWNPTKKSIWLLFVAEHETPVKELTASRIATTFNQHFRSGGSILAGNVARDLNKARTDQPPLVQCDTTKNPAPWYLTDGGKKYAAELVKEARGPAE